MKTVDEILNIIDTGLQTAGDDAYGNDWPNTCWRCGDTAEDLCKQCRATLLIEETTTNGWTVLINLDLDQFVESLDALVAGFADLPLDMRRALAQGVLDDLPTIEINTRSTSECLTSPHPTSEPSTTVTY